MNLTFHQFKYLLVDSLVMSLLWYILEYIIDSNEVELKAKQILIWSVFIWSFIKSEVFREHLCKLNAFEVFFGALAERPEKWLLVSFPVPKTIEFKKKNNLLVFSNEI